MALDREILSSLGLEIAKKKYYNASKVESVIEDMRRHAAAQDEENAALRARLEVLSYGKEEIGDAILSAKTIAQQLLAEAQEEADKLLSGAREEADRLLSKAKSEAGRLVSDAREEAERLVTEAEEQRAARLGDCERYEQEAIRKVESAYVQLREQYTGAIRTLDQDWQRFLCSLGDGAEPKTEDALPEDLADRLGAIAESLEALKEEE